MGILIENRQKNPDTEALERMRKQIEAEGKHGILIPEGIKPGDEIKQFTELINKETDPKDIVFYNLTSGILKHNATVPHERFTIVYYLGPDRRPSGYSNFIRVDVSKDKKIATLEHFFQYKDS